MVKANAYGHDIETIVSYCEQEKLCSDFGVASINELVDIKNLNDSDFWVFSEVDLKNNHELYKRKNIIPVLSNLADLKYFLDNFDHDKIVLKFDTGMNRLGFVESDLDGVIELLKKNNVKSIKHVLTHFSSSYFKIKEDSKACDQFQLFQRIKETLKSSGFTIYGSSCSNSGAIEQSFGSDETHIRPGLMMYGPKSYGIFNKNIESSFKTISSLKSKIISKKFFKQNSEIGYGDTKLDEDGWIVIIPLGYGDGVLNYYVGANVKCSNEVGKIFGRVNMDLCFIYFKNEPSGDEIVIWDDNLVEFSNQVRSIPYQVLTSITQRVPKVFKY